MKKRCYQIRPQAQADLDGHARTIARENLEAGLKLYDLAAQTYDLLERFQDKWIRLSGSKTRPTKKQEPGFGLTKTEQALAEMPYMGAIYHTTKPELMGLRYLPIKEFSRYLVFYKPANETVDIIRVLHARMDKDSWL